MNKTVVFITFAALAAIGIIGSVILLLHRPDASATFTNLIVLVLGLVASSAGTFAVLGKVDKKIEQVRTQTNGTLTAKENRIAELQAEISRRDRLTHPSNFDSTTGETVVPVVTTD